MHDVVPLPLLMLYSYCINYISTHKYYTMKLRDLIEAKPTKTMDPTELDWDTMFDDPTSKGELAAPPKPEKKQELPQLKRAGAKTTAKAMKGVGLSPEAGEKLAGLNIPADARAAEPDLPAASATEVTADNLPVLLTKQLKQSGTDVGTEQGVDPEWHQVKNLPGYMSKQIRVLGRETFKPYTTTPIEDITVIANLMGKGPNTDREVAAVAKWLKTNGTEVGRATMDYGPAMPGYTAETISYSASGMQFLLVQDFMGGYIYAWPESDSVKQIESPK